MINECGNLRFPSTKRGQGEGVEETFHILKLKIGILITLGLLSSHHYSSTLPSLALLLINFLIFLLIIRLENLIECIIDPLKVQGFNSLRDPLGLVSDVGLRRGDGHIRVDVLGE